MLWERVVCQKELRNAAHACGGASGNTYFVFAGEVMGKHAFYVLIHILPSDRFTVAALCSRSITLSHRQTGRQEILLVELSPN